MDFVPAFPDHGSITAPGFIFFLEARHKPYKMINLNFITKFMGDVDG